MNAYDTVPATAEHGPAVHHKVNYYAIFALLVVLTILTVAVARFQIHLVWVKVLLAVAIAWVKASFVAMYFMHLKFEGKLIYFIVGVPVCFVVLVVCALIPDIVLPALHHAVLGQPPTP